MIPAGYRCIECGGTEAHAEACGQPAREAPRWGPSPLEGVIRAMCGSKSRTSFREATLSPPDVADRPLGNIAAARFAIQDRLARESAAFFDRCAEEDSREQLWRSDGGPMEGLRFKP